MDRASILGDAIAYLNELLEKVNVINMELESISSSLSLQPVAVIPATANGVYQLNPTVTAVPSLITEEVIPEPIRVCFIRFAYCARSCRSNVPLENLFLRGNNYPYMLIDE